MMSHETRLSMERILYLSDSCAVLNKLSGEAVEGARPGMSNLPAMLAETLAGKSAPQLALPVPAAAHRLDVPVSGCAVFARTQAALSSLCAAFAGTALVEKRYWAIVEAPSPETDLPENGELIHWLSFDLKRNKSFAHTEPAAGRKKAALRYRIVGRGLRYLFVEIELVTGRRHQIRAQLAWLGLHIKGDLKYGSRRSEPDGGIRLHARLVSFPNPSDPHTRIAVTAPPPLRDNLWLVFEEAHRQALTPQPSPF